MEYRLADGVHIASATHFYAARKSGSERPSLQSRCQIHYWTLQAPPVNSNSSSPCFDLPISTVELFSAYRFRTSVVRRQICVTSPEPPEYSAINNCGERKRFSIRKPLIFSGSRAAVQKNTDPLMSTLAAFARFRPLKRLRSPGAKRRTDSALPEPSSADHVLEPFFSIPSVAHTMYRFDACEVGEQLMHRAQTGLRENGPVSLDSKRTRPRLLCLPLCLPYRAISAPDRACDAERRRCIRCRRAR